jgi:uncharacterized membrane protein YjgN (DUF898 family)
MTIVDQVGATATVPPPPPLSPLRLRFVGRIGDYWRLMIRGAALQAVTLGIYRFWLFTDMRRFLWAATQIAGETAEYTGTASELLIGFLIAIGILIPVYALFFIASLEYGILSRLSGILAFVVLAGFGEYAAYRARRYRLTRTVFRGLRFHQTGSAVRYAVRAMLWWVPVVLTLGLAWPWAAANLERYKMRNTFYGNLGGSFAGSGTRLFGRGLLIWLLVVGPLVAGLAAALAVVDRSAVKELIEGGDLQVAAGSLPFGGNETFFLGALLGGVTWSVLFGAVLYPAYQVIVMRWWLGGLRLGGAAAASDLRIGRYYIDFTRPSLLRDGVAAAAGIVAYVIYILGTYTIYQVVVKMRLWQAAVESMLISGYAAFDHVRAGEAASSAIGEGLADALGGGGI